MEFDRNRGQGQLSITDAETGKTYIIPQGGSDGGDVSVGSDTGTVSDAGEGVQSVESAPPSTTEGSGNDTSGQGFLEPYLRDLPEDQRAIAEPVLDKYRREQDAEVNRRFEELKQQSEIPNTVYQALMQDPIQTLDWIADRMQEERGIDVRAQLKDRWYESQGLENPQSGQGEESQSGQESSLTQSDIERILEEREQAKINQERQQTYEQQQVEQQHKTINSWIDDAAKKFSLSLDDSQGEDPLRPVIIMQANKLFESGTAQGQAAIEMAAEAVSKRFGSRSNGNGSQQPNLATGGSPPPQKKIDVSNEKDRKNRMFELLTPPSNH